jgi:hypothetical protein
MRDLYNTRFVGILTVKLQRIFNMSEYLGEEIFSYWSHMVSIIVLIILFGAAFQRMSNCGPVFE